MLESSFRVIETLHSDCVFGDAGDVVKVHNRAEGNHKVIRCERPLRRVQVHGLHVYRAFFNVDVCDPSLHNEYACPGNERGSQCPGY